VRKITALILSLLFLLSAFCGHAAVLTKAEIYEASVSSLKSYLNDEPTEAMGDLVLAFGKLGDYKFSAPFMLYASVLRSVENEDYSTVQAMFKMLRMNTSFTEHLASDPDFGPLEDLENYAAGRKAEAEGDPESAMLFYEACTAYYDSYSRLTALYSGTLENSYKEALSLFNMNTFEGYVLAAALFESLAENDYKDSAAMAEASKMFVTIMEEAMKEAERKEAEPVPATEEEPEIAPPAEEETEMIYKVGDTVYWGSYLCYSYHELIEWRILDIADGRMLLLSEKGLTLKEYDDGSDVWENSTLRAWLNNDSSYPTIYLTEREKSTIVSAPLKTKESTSSEADAYIPGNEFFLLSLEEATRYKVENTFCYLIYNTSSTINKTYPWWLRDTDDKRNSDALTSKSNNRSVQKTYSSGYAVRPAVWVDAKSFSKEVIYFEDYIASDSHREGDRIYFGSYELDGNNMNGKEAIKWRVLEVAEDRMLVISEDVLDSRVYHSKAESVTWETSELRFWLNDFFFRTAFASKEKNRILESDVINSFNPTTGIRGGNDTQDRIFLLSIDEAQRYFADDSDRNAKGPVRRTADIWALRTPGDAMDKVATVDRSGKISANGWTITSRSQGSDYVYRTVARSFGIRPALWIRLDP